MHNTMMEELARDNLLVVRRLSAKYSGGQAAHVKAYDGRNR